MYIEKLGLSKTSLSGKVAIITGAGRGIGKELARALAWLGARVIIAEINNYGKDVEKLILSEGGSAMFIKTDVSKEDDIINLEKIVIEKFGRIDILINNAYASATGEILEIPIEDWDKIYQVNIRAAIFTIKTFLPYMLAQNSGVINTLASAEGWPYMAPYFATKTALLSIGKSLAAELEHTNVSVFVFGPGMVDTPGLQEYVPIIAPKYGMTVDEFKNQDVNPGYDGLMPAEHCAAGWAYCIVNAKEYHGQVAEPFSPLLQKGIIQPNKIEELEINDMLIENTEELMSHIKEQSNKVLGIVKEEQANMDKLGKLAKKWMTRTFFKRCGMNIEKCVDTLDQLKLIIQNSDKKSEGDYNLDWYIHVLKNLSNHFKLCIDDAKGWIKDKQQLKESLDVLTERINDIMELISSLNKLKIVF